jgi:glucosylceramidase
MMHLRHFCTAQNTAYRLTELPPLTPGTAADAPASVLVDPAVRYQEIEGFGGAFTEAAALTFYRLPPPRQAEILQAYFDPVHGLGYTLCRTHINSCDFSLGNYAYDEVDGDVELRRFSIERDRRALIPLIRAAQAAAGRPIRLLASPWSPPAWMKTNGDMCHGGKLKPEYRAAWAAYYGRYIREYEAEGIPIWGLTVQNEPLATQVWESCIYTAEEERDFVRDYLGPTLAAAGLGEVRLLIWDHNRDLMVERARAVLSDPAAAQYIWGIGFHWYVHDRFDNVLWTHDAFPDKRLIFTEGSQEGGPHLGEWHVGERYAHSMINDLNRWTAGWIDWNLLLDETGGPNHVGNFCSAPIIADTRTGELHYQSSFYAIGHFARFVQPGARRILCATSHDALEAAAFLNPDGQMVAIVLNRSDETIPFALQTPGAGRTRDPDFGELSRAAWSAAALPHSIATYVFRTK